MTDEAELADDLFAHDRSVAGDWIASVLEGDGVDAADGDVRRPGDRAHR